MTGDEKMTGAQANYLKTLCEKAGEEFDASLTKAEASERIDPLQEKPKAEYLSRAACAGKLCKDCSWADQKSRQKWSVLPGRAQILK